LQSFSSAVSQSLHLQHMDTLQTSHKMNCNWDGEIQKCFTISLENVVYSHFTVFVVWSIGMLLEQQTKQIWDNW
jgi:hypothetical protein